MQANELIRPKYKIKGKIPIEYTLCDAYEYYKVYYDAPKFQSRYALNTVDIVPKKLYKAILKDFFIALKNKILYNAAAIDIPFNLGYIKIQKKKMNLTALTRDKNNLKVDWAETKKHKKIIYHLNDHRNGCRYKWYWNKKRIRVQNCFPYKFIASRANKRELAMICKKMPQLDFTL